jgi:two-component system, chemotaxis family, protein-glutamate methylesterase/glutaminase
MSSALNSPQSSGRVPGAPIRVFVIDDSALIRAVLTQIINSQRDMQVVGVAADPLQARERMRELVVDVVTLDVEMPRMDGLEFLEKLMRLRPTPVVMVSTLTERGADVTLRAMELGAIDFVTKPKMSINQGMQETALEICEKIRNAAGAKVFPRTRAESETRSAATPLQWNRQLGTEKIIAIGSSTGGTEAVKHILLQLPPDSPAILVTQHMPPGFTKSFAARLDGLARVRVAEGVDGERALPGRVYIAPGGRHMSVRRSGASYSIALSDDDPVNRHKPSVDVLFRSIAAVAGPNAAGIMLTGMGKDGAQGMLEMFRAGAFNIAQDEATCVVFGMPREAIAVGAVHEVLPLDRIARSVLDHLGSAGVVPGQAGGRRASTAA